MFFQQVYEKGLAQASYIIGCQASKTAVVIDPKRDIDTYLAIAKQERLNITHIAETHIHADFLSGSRELAEVTGAEMFLSDEGGPDWQYEFPHTGLNDGDTFMVGNIKIEALHTPGHTPEHISFLVTDMPAGDYPMMILTGDFVFVGDVGRPDLLEKAAGITGTQEKGARDLFDSLNRFKALPDYVQVWPGHGAGSACGKALGAVPSSTVGYEKQTNWALQYDEVTPFVPALLEGQPEPPVYFAMMKSLNKIPRILMTTLRAPEQLTAEDVALAMERGTPVIDTRNRQSFVKEHIPGSISIPARNGFSTWAGWLLDYETPFVLIASPDEIDYFVRALVRIGLDNIQGYLPDIRLWRDSGRSFASVNEITPVALKDAAGREDLQVVDVRGYAEYRNGHINGAMNIHAGELLKRAADLPEDGTLVLQCAGGDRAVMAYSLLAKQGRGNLLTLAGGINAWRAAKFEVDEAA